ncbi:MAG: Orn/Lys/Arg decarboxylase N-terminal domain-containing protein [Victivallaceae bacterium]|nr:Orn/Lys/Arg decarboxylase N-terminal domain-containing protein [Victivallaceae bacterium]
MKITQSAWPIVFVSDEFGLETDNGIRLNEIIHELVHTQECRVIKSFSYEDALELFMSRADIGCVIVDWELPDEKVSEKMTPDALVAAIRARNSKVPLLLLTDKLETENLPTDVLAVINGCLWKNADTAEFIAGRIEVHLMEYVAGVYPPFFGELVKYAEEYKYAWHTPGHLGGQGFLRSPAGVAFYKFFGENTFRADLSISVPELGSLLDHEGAVGDAERNSARVFGADRTFYVLNGTSTVNQIIWRSRLVNDELALVDRNCHKSLNYAMVITGAIPVYMVPRRNRRGIIGPVRLSEFGPESVRAKIEACPLVPKARKDDPVKMSALTNSTYDGVCYNVVNIKKQLKKSVESLHFDEAWYAYAKFSPMYADHFGMTDSPVSPDDPPVFCSQSTHKLLTAFSQASMLHIKDGGSEKIDPAEFNESYMMHGSTSPQYSMIASLDVATKMMDDQGGELMHDIIREAVQLRRKIASINRELRGRGSWFFDLWQPKLVRFEERLIAFADADINYLASNQEPWVFNRYNNWHGFEDIEPDYVMLDPIKLTITTPGLDDNGHMDDTGIPATIVTNYLIRHNIVCEKTDYYSFLMLNLLGTTRAKQGTLLAALFAFKEAYDGNLPVTQVFPELASAHPGRYDGEGLADHCTKMHEYLRKHRMLDRMQAAFEVIPDQAMKPADAYHNVVRRNVENVKLDDMRDRVPAVMLVPYPPGIPIIMGGEVLNERALPIWEYLRARQDFENEFPGYEGDIHGVERERSGGRTVFKCLCVKPKQ